MRVLSDGARSLWGELRKFRPSAETVMTDPAWQELLDAGLLDAGLLDITHLVDFLTAPTDVPEGGGIEWKFCDTCGWIMCVIWNNSEQIVKILRCHCKAKNIYHRPVYEENEEEMLRKRREATLFFRKEQE